MILDTFAGPGGWSEGLRSLGRADIGIEYDLSACRTRAAAGHQTIRADVAMFPLERLAGRIEGLIMSPPCPDFSTAGKGAGIEGESGRLILEVPRWVNALRPRWIACEQVPPALPWWERFAAEFQELGYMTWTGLLNAANYGVPQTRTRAFLLASLDREPAPPPSTHDRAPAPVLFGEELEPWVTMAEALGWGATARPITTIAAGHTRGTVGGGSGGSGGSGGRLTIERERDAGRWIVSTRGNSGRAQDDFAPSRTPSRTLTGKSDSWRVVTGGVTTDRYASRSVNEPAPPITGAGNTYVGSERAFAEGDVSDALKLSVSDALKLQSFGADYPVQGTKTKQFEQIGNAVPPVLAAAVLTAVL